MGPVLARLFSIKIKMRAFAFVLLSLAAVQADSDAYTIGQVASGHTYGGVVTGVDYGNGLVQGLGAIGNRAYAGYAGVGHLGYAGHAVAAPVAYGYGGLGYAGHYGKREAEADSDAYTIGQVAHGLPGANAYATGHPHNVGVVTGTTYAAPAYTGYAGVGHVGYAGHLGYAGLGYSGLGYTGLGYAGHYGKREADADSEAYTISQVAHGLPVANAYATGHPLNVGVVTGTTSAAPAYTGYAGVGHLGYAGHLGYSGLGYSGLGYTGLGYAGHYGKREADADSEAYTIGQVAHGLPVANAYATGHPHNVGVVTGTTYAAP